MGQSVIVRIAQRALGERQAAAADAIVEPVAQPLQSFDAPVKVAGSRFRRRSEGCSYTLRLAEI